MVEAVVKQGFDSPKEGASPASDRNGHGRPEVEVLAHRGVSGQHPENSLGAFLEARRVGADGVELDVRRSADGALVVHHDAVIAGRGPVAGLRVADLPVEVPLLDAALEACAGMTVNVEIKNLPSEPGWDEAELAAMAVAQAVAERGLFASVVVSSFSAASLDAALAAEPDLVTALLAPPGADATRALEMAAERGHLGLHPHHWTVTPELVAAAHGRGLAVRAWTVDDTDRVRWLAEAGVDAVITNRPAAALEALGRAPYGGGG